MTVEDLLTECGGFGQFQVLAIFGIYTPKMVAGWSMMQMSFAGYIPEWNCQSGERFTYNGSMNDSMDVNKCTFDADNITGTSHDCSSFRFSGPARTAVTEWGLVCDKKWVKATITSIQMAGVLVGALLAGQLSDLIGRKKSLFGVSFVHSLINFAAAFSTSWEMFTVFRFFLGVGIGAILVVTFPFLMEFMPLKWRPLQGTLPAWPIGVGIFAVAAFFLKDWSYLHIGCGVFGLISMIGYFYIPESVRWLTARGRYKEAEEVFIQIARVNKRPAPKQTKSVLQRVHEEEEASRANQKKFTYLDLFRGWRATKINIIFCYSWFMISTVFYGISFGVSALSGNMYLNIFLVAFIEVPLVVTTFHLNNRFGRRVTITGMYLVGALSSLGCLIVQFTVQTDDRGDWVRAFSLIAKMGIGGAWVVSQTWSTELYPTVVRSLGYGMINSAARVGGIAAPFLIDLDERQVETYIIITAMVTVAIILTPFLPETQGKQLPDGFIAKPNQVEDSHKNELPSVSNNRVMKQTMRVDSPTDDSKNTKSDINVIMNTKF